MQQFSACGHSKPGAGRARGGHTGTCVPLKRAARPQGRSLLAGWVCGPRGGTQALRTSPAWEGLGAYSRRRRLPEGRWGWEDHRPPGGASLRLLQVGDPNLFSLFRLEPDTTELREGGPASAAGPARTRVQAWAWPQERAAGAEADRKAEVWGGHWVRTHAAPFPGPTASVSVSVQWGSAGSPRQRSEQIGLCRAPPGWRGGDG